MKSIADAFADRLGVMIDNLMGSINAADFNPVRCCICAALDLPGRVEAVIKGYGTCTEHMLTMDSSATLAGAVELAKMPRPRVVKRQTG